MTARLNPWTVAPDAFKPLMDLEAQIAASSLEQSLIELVKMRASQINGCAFCLHMHSRDARAAGETEERLYLLNGWRESNLYTPRERAALAWTEALTRVADTHAPDADYQGLAPHLSELEVVNLTLLIMAINAWNRMAIGFRSQHPRHWVAKAAYDSIPAIRLAAVTVFCSRQATVIGPTPLGTGVIEPATSSASL